MCWIGWVGNGRIHASFTRMCREFPFPGLWLIWTNMSVTLLVRSRWLASCHRTKIGHLLCNLTLGIVWYTLVASHPSRIVVWRTLGASLFASTFAIGICDLVTLVTSIKVSIMLWEMLWKVGFIALQFQIVQCEDLNETSRSRPQYFASLLGKLTFLSPPSDWKIVL